MAKSFKEFMKPKKVENHKFKLSNRYVDDNGELLEFEIRPLNKTEMDRINKQCTKISNKGLQDLDMSLYGTKLITESLVTPDLHNVELQESFGASNEKALVDVMFTSGECNKILEEINKLNGISTLNEDIEDAKN